MFTHRVTLGSASVVVRSERPLEAWAEWLAPYGSLETLSDEVPGFHVLIGNDVCSPCSFDDVTPTTLHGGMTGLKGASEQGIAFANVGKPAVYEIAADRLALSYPLDRGYWELDAFQIVRGFLQAIAETQGRHRFRGSAVARSDRGLAMVGAPGSGTTSFMLELLRSGDYAFVADERLHIDESGTLYGLPVATPEWPTELNPGLRTLTTASVPLTAIVVCVNRSSADVTVEALPADEREALISASGPVSPATDPARPQWLLDAAGLQPPIGLPDVASKVPWFRVTGNPQSPDWPTRAAELLS